MYTVRTHTFHDKCVYTIIFILQYPIWFFLEIKKIISKFQKREVLEKIFHTLDIYI